MPKKPNRAAGAAASLAFFSRLIGIERRGLPCRLQAVNWESDHFELRLEIEGQGPLSLIIEAASRENRRPFLSNRRLALWYQGQGELPDFLSSRLERAMKSWRGLSLAKLRDTFFGQPGVRELTEPARADSPGAELDQGERQAESEGDESIRPPGIGSWAPEYFYGDFLGVRHFELMPFESIEASNPFVRISHSDLECISFMPQEKASNLFVVDFTWLGEKPGREPAKAQERTYCTDLDEQAVVMGCNQRARKVLDLVLERHPGGQVIFTNTCLPATTGEDTISLLEKYRRRAAVSISAHNRALVDFADDMLKPLLEDRRLRAEKKSGRPDPRAINLVGFAPDRSLAELVSLLGAAGIKVNQAILPRVSAEAIDRLARAGLNVFSRTSPSWKHFHDQLTSGSRLRSIQPASPYGLEGTRRWLEEILGSLEIDGDAAGVLAGHCPEQIRHFAELREQAARHWLGIVVRSADTDYLLDPSWTNGVPVLEMLDEMGFGVEIFIERPDGNDTAEKKLSDSIGRLRRSCLERFSDLPGLRAALGGSRCRAVLSNFTQDWRLGEAGKNRFAFKHFEMGPAGSCRTLERLLHICRADFFSRYRRYLRRDETGHRIPAGE